MTNNTCPEVGCKGKIFARGLCASHYQRNRRNGVYDNDEGKVISNIASSRALRELLLRGYERPWIAKELGMSPNGVYYIATRQREVFRESTEDTVFNLYDTLTGDENLFGGSLRTMKTAKGDGFMTCARYEDIVDVDSKILPPADIDIDIDTIWLFMAGTPEKQIAQRLRIPLSRVTDRVDRLLA